jgi:hypothetical protein
MILLDEEKYAGKNKECRDSDKLDNREATLFH